MSESKIFFRLTQATNTYKHTNIGATMTYSRKLAHEKVFFPHKKTFLKNNSITITKGYSSKYLK